MASSCLPAKSKIYLKLEIKKLKLEIKKNRQYYFCTLKEVKSC